MYDDDELGRLEHVGERSVLRYTRHLAHPPAKVWRALTESEELEGWFPTTIEGERVSGAKLRYVFPEHLGVPTMDGEMLAYEPNSLMELNWGGDIVRFELAPEGAGTVLELVVTFTEHGKGARDGAGWHVCLRYLARFVDGAERPVDDGSEWRQVHPKYVASLGPEASTLGPPEEWEQTHPTTEAQASS
jgi:uncharacterized protein YndB with AHSA1/START domain